MARTIAEIQAEIIAAKEADATLSGLTSTSSTAIWRLWTRIVATAIFVLESLFDAHKEDVEALLLAQKPHSLYWYQSKALAFQFGSDLPDGKDEYDNTLLDDATVEAQQVVAEAAVTEQGGAITIKVAKESASELEALSVAEKAAFSSYMAEVKDAGVEMSIVSESADQLKVYADVYYDPQILNSDGGRLDGADSEPVQNAIKNHLRNLSFNGELVLAHLVDAMQLVDGVNIPHLTQVQAAAFADANFFDVQVRYQPVSGFFRVYNSADIVLNFIADV